MQIEVAEQWICNAPQAFSPCFQAGYAIYAEAQNLGLDPIEPVENCLVGWDLARSDRRPSQREEYQHHVLLPGEIAQANFVTKVAVETKFMGGLTNIECHVRSFFEDLIGFMIHIDAERRQVSSRDAFFTLYENVHNSL
jgi:hypothetical protein